MSNPKFLADEHIKVLKKEDIDILTVQEVGQKGIDDVSLFEFALKHHRTIITRDADFLVIAGEKKSHSGAISLTKRLRIGTIIKQVEKLVLLYNREDLENTII